MLRQAVLELSSRVPAAMGEELVALTAHSRGGCLVDTLASAVVPGLERRWELLCELDVGKRFEEHVEYGEPLRSARLG